MPTIDEAQREALASMPALEMMWDAVVIDHASLAAPIRLIRGPGVDTAINIEPPAAAPTFTAVAMEVVYPGFDEKGQPTDVALKIDGVGGRLVTELMALCAQTTPPTCDMYEVNPSDLAEFWTVVPNINIVRAQLDGTSVTLTLQYDALENINAPAHIYDRTRFPMLHRS